MTNLALALDTDDISRARKIVDQTDEYIDLYKVGLELYNAALLDPQGIPFLKELMHDDFVFLDLKLHDTPHTMARTLATVTHRLPHIDLLSVHLSAGPAALIECQSVVAHMETQLVGVSVLTSLSDADANQIYGRSASDATQALFNMAVDAGLKYVVCSVNDVPIAKQKGLITLCPGIRAPGENPGGQSRIYSIEDAYRAEVDYAILGRTITQAEDVGQAAKDMSEAIERLSHA